jgi:hypothetical protein
MAEVWRAWIPGSAEAGFEVARGHHSERADGRQDAALVAVDVVVAVPDADRLPTGTAGEIHVTDGNLAWVARGSVELARGWVTMATAAQVETSIVTVVGVDIAGIEIEHGLLPGQQVGCLGGALGRLRECRRGVGVAPGRGDEDVAGYVFLCAKGAPITAGSDGRDDIWPSSLRDAYWPEP